MIPERPDPAENLRLALELFEVGESMYRQKLKRQPPDWSEEAVENAVDEWLQRPAFEGHARAGASSPISSSLFAAWKQRSDE